MDDDWDEFDRACVEVLGYDPSDAEAFALYIEYTKFILEPAHGRRHVQAHARSRARERRVPRARRQEDRLQAQDETYCPTCRSRSTCRTTITFVNRLQWGLASVLAGLGGGGKLA